MTGQYVYGTNSGAGKRIVLTQDGSQVLVAATGAVVSSDNVAIEYAGSSTTVNVLGTVWGAERAIYLGNNEDIDHDNRIFVGETGFVCGSANKAAILLNGHDSLIVNDGSIWNKSSGGSGIILNASAAGGMSTIVNTGSIDAYTSGIGFFSNEKIHIDNSGLIRALTAIFGAQGSMDIVNTGHIYGDVGRVVI